jgi:hypothetical protein
MGDGARPHRPRTSHPMRLRSLLPISVLLAAACSSGGATGGSGTPSQSEAGLLTVGPAATSPSASPARTLPTGAPGQARLQPTSGTYFGLNLDWGSETARDASDRLGRTPAVWVEFARFPLDAGARANLDAFVQQVAGVGGLALITLEPQDGLAAVTTAAANDVADLLAGYWNRYGVRTFVRFAHEMNGSWYPWGQQPAAYVAAFRRVAAAVHERSPSSAMMWAPNEGSGYPFAGGKFGAARGSPDAKALDTNGDGALTRTDDPYAPYYPGDEAVDWIGVSLYQWGLAYPWGENEIPKPGTFANLLTGRPTGEQANEVAIPDLYSVYADGHDTPIAVVETAILYDPAAPAGGPTEAKLKTAWFDQVFAAANRTDFPRIGMINWFEWRKNETEVGRVIDWRLAADPSLARSLLASVPDGWLVYAGH